MARKLQLPSNPR